MKYLANLSYSLNTRKIEPGMDRPYKEYLKECRTSRVIPVAETIYPQYVYQKFNTDFVVNADSVEEVLEKIVDHKEVKKNLGKKIRFERDPQTKQLRPWHKCDNTLFFDFQSENKDLGQGFKCLTVAPAPPEQQCKTVFID